MIADLLASPISDREWFLDHGRRQYRFRLARPGEVKIGNADGGLDDVEGELGFLIRRDSGSGLACHVMDLSEVDEADWLDDDEVCGMAWDTLAREGLVPTTI